MPAAAPPAATAARLKTTHSGRLNPRMATAPRCSKPRAMSALPARRTSVAYSLQVVAR
jgi:hypothetical protein